MLRFGVILASSILMGCSTVPTTPNYLEKLDIASKDKAAIFIGEIHGTKETPELFYNMIEHQLRSHDKLAVGIELPEIAGRLDCGNLNGLDKDHYWIARPQDGRTSKSMANLVCKLKKLETNGLVEIVFFVGKNRPVNFEKLRAMKMIHALDKGTEKAFILVGNFHNERNEGSMVGQFIAAGYDVLTLTVSSPNTMAWVCTNQCGIQEFGSNFCKVDGQIPSLSLKIWGEVASDFRWDGCLNAPMLSASEPLNS